FHFPLKFLFRKLSCFVQPGCTIELLALPTACQFREFHSLGPADLLEFAPGLWWQMLVNGHQVVRLAPRLRESSFKKLVKGLQLFQAPVLPGAYFAEIPAKFDEFGLFLALLSRFPGEDLVDLRQHEQRSFLVQLRRHWRIVST